MLLVTDGLDREGGDGIRFQARRLRRSCRSLVWLNPLLRYRAFAPKAAGIRALLPEVDEHRPVHNLDSLARLAESAERAGWVIGGGHDIAFNAFMSYALLSLPAPHPESPMAQLTVRKLSRQIVAKLKQRAAANGRASRCGPPCPA